MSDEPARPQRGRGWLAVVLLPLVLACQGNPREFAITPRAQPRASPTREPMPSATPRPAPTATRTPLPSQLWVANAGREGVILRASPGLGERVLGLVDGTRLTPMGEEERRDGRRWVRVRENGGRVGWIAEEFVSATPPANTPTSRR